MVVLSEFPHPTEGIRLKQPNTTAHLNNTNLGKGTLYIAESRLSWIGSAGNGFSVEYRNISLHAVSRDLNAFPAECLFLMLDIAIEDQQDDLDDDDPDSEIITELRFVPEDRGMLDAMFHAMSACQALHPDPEDSFSDEDFYEDADEGAPMNETNSQMANLSIAQNRGAFGAVVSREAGTVEGTAADRSDRPEVVADREEEAADRLGSSEEGMVADMAVDMAAANTRSSSGRRNFCSSRTVQADNCCDTGCFDDAEN